MTAAKDETGSGVRDPEIVRAEAAIAQTREKVTLSVMALQRELTRKLDWRERVRQRPIMAVALAFGAGALLGSLLPPFQRRRH